MAGRYADRAPGPTTMLLGTVHYIRPGRISRASANRSRNAGSMTTDPARFDRVTEHPDYAATANRRIELPYGSVTAIAAPSAFAMFGILFLLIAIGLLVEIGPPLWFTIP